MGVPYLSLLPPDEDGVQLDPLTMAKIFLPGGNAGQNASNGG
jgi:hypothetical protein